MLQHCLRTVTSRVLKGTLDNYISNSARTMAVTTAFQKESIDVDLKIKSPTSFLELTYGKHSVQPGNVLTPTQVKDPPTGLTWPTEAGALYTLVMTDPDAPTRQDPKFGEWEHWLVVNIHGNNVASGETLAEYVGSGPPKDSGLHRYIFLVYKQSGKLTDSEHPRLDKHRKTGRAQWKVAKFAEKHRLGHPIAGNFYQAEYDDYVPILYAQLTS